MTRSWKQTFPAVFATLLPIVFLQGCNVGPKYKAPMMPTPPPAAFKETGSMDGADGTKWKEAVPSDTLPKGAWWEIYHDVELNSLEDRLNKSNQSLAQAFANFEAARALVREAKSQYFPQVSTSPTYQRNRTSDNLTNSQYVSHLESNIFEVPFSVSWEPDVWGRIRNQVRQAANSAQASAADLAAQKLSAQASLATDYFELRGQDALIDLYEQTIQSYEKSLRLTETLKDTGVDSQQPVAQARLNLKAAQASLSNLRMARAQYEHAIALLVGESASSFTLPIKKLDAVPPFIPPGIPSELLERRPDIAAAERTVASANAQIGVGKAAYYPSLTLSAQGGFESTALKHLFDWPSRFFSIGPTASETLFDGGNRRATVANYRAQYEADVAAYRQYVLTAFQQTEDALAGQHHLAEQYQEQQEASRAAKEYQDLAQNLFENGIDSYLDVTSAQTAFLQQQQAVLTVRIQQMTTSVQLIESLGGSWNRAELPSEKEVAKR